MTAFLNVYLDGVLAGQLAQNPGGALAFAYSSAYTARANPTPLSLAMPLSGSSHSNRVVSAWLEGLLPDNLAVREEWARRFEVSPRNPFALLRHVGRDAAGAVQVLPVDVDPSDAAQRTGDVRRLTDDEFSDLLLRLSVRDHGWDVGAGSGRWSLAGAQNKVALHRLDDGGWGVPQDSTPTTHILKPNPAGTRFEDLHVNEFVCLRAAGLLGLRVASVDLVDVGGAQTLVSTRYDRGRGQDGVWLRLHQEDLLQAMSYPPSKKYQSDGGPSVKNVASLLSTLSLADRDAVRSAFFDAFAFNVLIGGTDAHAKNYSLLLRGPRVAMAPLYDVASYAPYLKRGEAVRSSMKVGRHWHVRDVTVEDWVAVGHSLGLEAPEAVDRVERLRTGLPEVVLAAAEAAPAPFVEEARRVADAVAAQGHLKVPRLPREPRRQPR
ncbi:type II toxin-antitoxin system HipA family toxin [Ornithinimicrobium sp. F0845]|uniref:type II toxin-antitoxin system HipA family toxin n=1 Tax=Ornithinimicrobium sp. F0845 TaxID=2926412 RepID=UPI001FF11F18|nr:type II toxin-antitoxin system HipA family toxin [Ornithinimicrobium sp. F0845]MCK0113463.1 type II toxin-antitoxin system HipA family toxin [Ornithinimicrobium sp. F0845]